MSNKFSVEYNVYQVKERMFNATGLQLDYPDDWYEYEVFLLDSMGNIVSEWDSYFETYNGVQKLTKESATKGAEEIKNEIEKKHVDPSVWFTLVDESRSAEE